MARSLPRKKESQKKTGNKITDAADTCRKIIYLLQKIYYAYLKRQYREYKKCAKFKKKTGFWKFKKLKKLKKSKFYARKPIKY